MAGKNYGIIVMNPFSNLARERYIFGIGWTVDETDRNQDGRGKNIMLLVQPRLRTHT